MDASAIFIDISKRMSDINYSFIDINKKGLHVKTAAHSIPPWRTPLMTLKPVDIVLFQRTYNRY